MPESCHHPGARTCHGRGKRAIVAASDYAIASSNTVFRFSEVRLGLVPAIVSPYVIGRVGIVRAKEMFLTGMSYAAEEAERYGLINRSCPSGLLDEVLNMVTVEILKASPLALRSTKQMINRLGGITNSDEILSFTSGVLAGARSSDEGREGIDAFLEKRKPFWFNEEK